MKLGKPTGKDFGNAATLAGGAFVGIGFAKGVFSLVHDEDKILSTEDEKFKNNMLAAAKHAGIAAVALGAASVIKSNDFLSVLSKGVLYGISAQSVSAGVTIFAETADKSGTLANSTNGAAKVAAKALGLKGCGCGGHQLNGARSRSRRRPGLKGIGVFSPNDTADFVPAVEQFASPFEAALNQGRLLSA